MAVRDITDTYSACNLLQQSWQLIRSLALFVWNKENHSNYAHFEQGEFFTKYPPKICTFIDLQIQNAGRMAYEFRFPRKPRQERKKHSLSKLSLMVALLSPSAFLAVTLQLPASWALTPLISRTRKQLLLSRGSVRTAQRPEKQRVHWILQ